MFWTLLFAYPIGVPSGAHMGMLSEFESTVMPPRRTYASVGKVSVYGELLVEVMGYVPVPGTGNMLPPAEGDPGSDCENELASTTGGPHADARHVAFSAAASAYASRMAPDWMTKISGHEYRVTHGACESGSFQNSSVVTPCRCAHRAITYWWR